MARSMASSPIVGHHESLLLLLLLQLSCSLVGAQSSNLLPVPCQQEQASALLRLKASFPFCDRPTCAALGSWQNGTDCCRWEGVSCGYVPGYTGGQVISLDLSNCACGELEKRASLDAVALFSLPSLRHVNRFCSGFTGSSAKMPPPQQQQEGLEGLAQAQPKSIHHYLDLYIKEEEERRHKWLRTLLLAVLALGLYPIIP